jgi:hypothetical protein
MRKSAKTYITAENCLSNYNKTNNPKNSELNWEQNGPPKNNLLRSAQGSAKKAMVINSPVIFRLYG